MGRITVKFHVQQPQQRRNKAGEVIPGPTLDEAGVLEWLRGELEPRVTQEFGEVDFQVIPSRTPEVRLDGTFSRPPKEVKNKVSELLAAVMDEFDAEPFVREPEM